MPRRVQALLIGLIVAAYWIRVMHMARKIKQRVGHSANVIPPERIGWLTRLVWFPVVGLWIGLPLLAPFIRTRQIAFHPIFRSVWLAWTAVAVAAVAFGATLICWKKMGSSWRMGIDPNEKTQLIVSGPYAYVRHPIYALSSLLMLATVAAYPTPLMIFVGAVHLCLLQLESRREEAYLLRVHGAVYGSYRDRVGRFLPRFGGRIKTERISHEHRAGRPGF